MTARSIGEIAFSLKPAKVARTFQPVRAKSYYPSDPKSQQVWRGIADSRRNARRIIAVRLEAAVRYNEINKMPGDREGPIGDIGIRILRALYGLVDFKTGRLDPAIDTICAMIKRARSTVVKYLKLLKEHNFLEWERRCEPTDNEGQAGPQVRQISNAYGFKMPKFAADIVARKLGNGPAPGCDVSRREQDAAETSAMFAGLSEKEFVEAITNDPQTADLLKKIADGIKASSASLKIGQNPGENHI